jgi:hypothetical protein
MAVSHVVLHTVPAHGDAFEIVKGLELHHQLQGDRLRRGPLCSERSPFAGVRCRTVRSTPSSVTAGDGAFIAHVVVHMCWSISMVALA